MAGVSWRNCLSVSVSRSDLVITEILLVGFVLPVKHEVPAGAPVVLTGAGSVSEEGDEGFVPDRSAGEHIEGVVAGGMLAVSAERKSAPCSR
mgnify:CR=1 FL=1